MECICVPQFTHVGEIQDMRVIEPPAVNINADITPPHLIANVPHQLPPCPDDDPHSHNNHHNNHNNHHNNHSNHPINHDTELRRKLPPKKKREPQENSDKAPNSPNNEIPEGAESRQNDHESYPIPSDLPYILKKRENSRRAVFGLNIFIGFLLACLFMLVLRKF